MRCSSSVWMSVAAHVVCVALLSSVAVLSVAAEEPPASEATSDFDAKISAALDKQGDWDFIDTPLSDVADFLRDSLEVDVLLDRKALEDSGVDSATPVSLSVHGITARSALRLLLHPLGLTYVTHDEALWITTLEKYEATLVTRVYPVGQLIRAPGDSGEDSADYDTLIQVVTGTIAQDTWDEVGGPGSIAAIYGSLAISQTRDVHDQIEGFLNAAKQLADANVNASDPSILLLPGETAGNDPIRDALQKPVSGEFVETSLRDVITYLTDAAEIPILLDGTALEDLGVDQETLVSAVFSQLALEHALRRILQELELTFVVRDEVLLITTPESEEAQQVLAIYPVDELVGDSRTSIEGVDFDSLIEAIQSTVHTDSWDEVGGPGAMAPLYYPKSCLVVSQTAQVHKAISELLSKLRWAKQQESGLAGAAQDATSGLSVRIYVLRPMHQQLVTPDSLIPLITRELGSEIWTTDEGDYLETLGMSLVVKHNADVHRRLGSFLKKLGVWDTLPVHPGGFGGGGGFGPPAEQPAAGGASAGTGGFGGGMGGGGGGYF